MRLFKENGNKNVSLLDSPRPLIFIGHVTKYYVVVKNSLKGICAFQIELEFGNVGFFRRRENRSTRRKTSRSNGENQQQTQLTYGVDPRIRTRVTLVAGECSHHCATLAPPRSQISLCTPRSLCRERSCNQNTTTTTCSC